VPYDFRGVFLAGRAIVPALAALLCAGAGFWLVAASSAASGCRTPPLFALTRLEAGMDSKGDQYSVC